MALEQDTVDQLIEVLDSALTSDNPAVMSAMQNLILLASLTNEKKDVVGPITQLLNRLHKLEREIDSLRRRVEMQDRSNTKSTAYDDLLREKFSGYKYGGYSNTSTSSEEQVKDYITKLSYQKGLEAASEALAKKKTT